MTVAVGGGLMCAAGLLFFFGGGWLTGLFLGQQGEETAQVTVRLLKIVAIAMPPFALSTILTGGLRGAGDTRWPLLFTFVGFLLVRIPLAYYLAWDQVTLPIVGWQVDGWGLGVVGAWYAMLIDCFLRAVMVGWRFGHGGWQRIQV
jgi:Na+-driven multidrug efflux pump